MFVVIVGCGRVGSELAQLLSSEGHDIVVIDKSPASLERLGNTFNGVVLVGNGFNPALLKQINIERADVFCAVTNGDNTNLVAAQVAKRIFHVPKVIARVYDPQRAHIYAALGLDVISGTTLFASMLRDKIVESLFSSYLIETKDLGVIEIEVKNGLVGQKIRAVSLPGEFLVAAIRKVHGVVIPDGDTVLEKGDTLMGVVKVASLDIVKKKFKL
ncbi:MAG: TrkA family potassium uptake protein [Candidatus Omnitrophota bacterium]|jgi:trk system potassium uptake protein TrkA